MKTAHIINDSIIDRKSPSKRTCYPDKASARAWFDYANDALVWLPRPGAARWNKKCAGKPVGTKQADGYVKTHTFERGNLRVHRLVWIWHHGPIPADRQIDHINRIRHDNRIENLRLVTPSENRRNTVRSKRQKKRVRAPVHRPEAAESLAEIAS